MYDQIRCIDDMVKFVYEWSDGDADIVKHIAYLLDESVRDKDFFEDFEDNYDE